jgi:hypothetical protein
VARLGFLNGVNRQHANGIGHLFGQFRRGSVHENFQNMFGWISDKRGQNAEEPA